MAQKNPKAKRPYTRQWFHKYFCTISGGKKAKNVVIHRLLHENQPPKIHHASCWSIPAVAHIKQRVMFVRHAIYVHSLARSHTTIHKGKTSIRRIVTISLSFRASKWIFFSAAPAKSSYTCMHTHQQTTHESVLRAMGSPPRASSQRLSRFLFLFISQAQN